MCGSFREEEIVGSFRRLLTISSAIDPLVVILLDRGLVNDILIRDIAIQTSIETLPNYSQGSKYARCQAEHAREAIESSW